MLTEIVSNPIIDLAKYLKLSDEDKTSELAYDIFSENAIRLNNPFAFIFSTTQFSSLLIPIIIMKLQYWDDEVITI